MNRKKISALVAVAALSAGLLAGCSVPGKSSMPELPKEVKTSCQVGKYYEIMVQNGAVEMADEIAKITRAKWYVDGNWTKDAPQAYTVGSGSKIFQLEQIITFENLTSFTADVAKRKRLAQDVAKAFRARGWEVVEPADDGRGVIEFKARDAVRRASISIYPRGYITLTVNVLKDSSSWKNAPKRIDFSLERDKPECQIPGMKPLPGIPGASRN